MIYYDGDRVSVSAGIPTEGDRDFSWETVHWKHCIRNTEMYYKKKCPVPVYKQVFLSAGKPKLVLFCVSLTLTGLKTKQNKTEFR